MAVATSTITGQILNPALEPVANARLKVTATSVGGALTTTGGDLITYQTRPRTDDDGNLDLTLPQLPQAGVNPSDARWRIEFPPRFKMAPIEFQLTGNVMWNAIVDVSGSDPSTDLLEQLTSLRDDVLNSTQPHKALAPWFAALANRDTAPAKLLFIGNSILEGTGASTFAQRSQQLIRDRLRAKYPTVAAPGAGHIPVATAWPPFPPITTSGTPDVVLNDFGLGKKAMVFVSGESVTWPATYCDRIRLWYDRDPFFGPFDVKIDGTTVASLTSNGANDSQQWDSGALTAGTHTLSVEGTNASFAACVEAAEFFNGDYGKGVHTYDGAHFGFSVLNFVDATADRGHWLTVADLKPQLTIIDLMVNSWGFHTPAQFVGNISAVLSRLATAMGSTPYCVLLVAGYKPVREVPPADADWDAMRDGLRGLAGGNIAFYDMDASWPTLVAGGGNNNGLMVETTYPLHPSDAGHDLYADLILDAITTNRVDETGVAGAVVSSVQGRTGAVTITKTDLSLGNVDNTSDLAKPISTATQDALDDLDSALSGKAPVAYRIWTPGSPGSWSARPTVPTGVPVVASSTHDSACTTPPPSATAGDIWYYHPSAAV